jgi:hypothetical protein
MTSIDKKTLSERDICTKFITPAVGKVDELMALCNQLKTQLTTTQTKNHNLFNSLLTKTLAKQTGKDCNAYL